MRDLTTKEDVLDGGKRQLSKLRAQKTALMQGLLTGRRRVTALLDPKAVTG